MGEREQSARELKIENAELKRVCLLLLRTCESTNKSEHGGGGDLLAYTPGLRRAARRLTNGVVFREDFEEDPAIRLSEKIIIKSLIANTGVSHA